MLAGGAGNDVFNLGSTGNSLDGFASSACVEVQGGANDAAPTQTVTCPGTSVSQTLAVGDTLNVNDQGDGDANTYSLTATTYGRNGLGPMEYSTIETLNLNTGNGNDTINVASTAASVTTTINANNGADQINVTTTGASSILSLNGGSGNDTFNLGNTGNSQDGLAGSVCVNGEANDPAPTTTQSVDCNGTSVSRTLAVGDTLSVNDQGDGDANTYSLTATTYGRTGIPNMGYSTIETLNLNTGAGNDTINVSTTTASAKTTINAGNGADQITVSTTGNSSILNLNGGSGNDNPITVQNTGGSSVTTVQGGSGNDTLVLQNNGANSGVSLMGETGGADSITVSATSAGSVTQVNGGQGGPDAFSSGPPGSLQGTRCGVGLFSLESANVNVAENVNNAVFTVTRSNGTLGTATVDYATSNGTATAGSDYTATTGTLNFADDVTSRTILVPITNDPAAEGNETFNVTLSNPSPAGWATLGSPTTGVATSWTTIQWRRARLGRTLTSSRSQPDRAACGSR